MKSDRLLSLLLLLQSRGSQSARELADQLEVSARTIYRDVDALALAGIPIYAERGSCGGIVLSDGYRKALTQFNTHELHALFLSSSDPLAELGVLGRRSALDKIEGALPDLQRRSAREVRQRVLIDHNKWYRAQQPTPLLAVLRRTVWDSRRVRLAYKDRTGTRTERIVDPYGLVSKAGVWYLIARQRDGEMRTFRVERITRAAELSSQFVRDESFDLEAHWQSTNSAVERPMEWFDAKLHVVTDALEWVMSYNESEVLDANERGKTLLVRFPSFGAAVHQIAGWGARARVLDPLELQAAVVEHARLVLALYESGA